MDDETRSADRAYARGFPFLLGGGLALMFGVGIALGGWWLPDWV